MGGPVHAGEELLHAVRGTVAGCLGEVPAVLPLQGSKQALKISQGASTRLRAPKLRGNPPSNRLQLLSPVLGFAPARHGAAPPPHEGQPAKPGCSSRWSAPSTAVQSSPSAWQAVKRGSRTQPWRQGKPASDSASAASSATAASAVNSSELPERIVTPAGPVIRAAGRRSLRQPRDRSPPCPP